MLCAIVRARPPNDNAVANPRSDHGIAVKRDQAAIDHSHCLKVGPDVEFGVNAGGGNQRF
jgi:hypothetical protein